MDAAEIAAKPVEDLTPDEKQFIMGLPPDEAEVVAAPSEPVSPKDPPKPIEKQPEAAAEPSEAKKEDAKEDGIEGVGKEEAAKIEAQVEKPEAEIDLTGISKTGKGLLFDLRRAKYRAQEAERQRDTLQLERSLAEREKRQKEDVARDPEEVVTWKEVKQREEALKGEQAALFQRQQNKLWEIEAKINRPDFDQVMNLGEAIISGNSQYQADIKAAFNNGENVAVVIYDLIKADPSYKGKQPAPAPQPSAIKEAGKLKANAEKVPTTGKASSGGSDMTEELSVEYISEKARDPHWFGTLSAEKRQKVLLKLEST